MSGPRQRVVVSVGTTFCLAFAAIAPALLDHRRLAPAYALSSSVVLYLERSILTDSAAAAAQREESTRRELLTKLAASNAQRAVLRERFYAALRQLDRLAEGRR